MAVQGVRHRRVVLETVEAVDLERPLEGLRRAPEVAGPPPHRTERRDRVGHLRVFGPERALVDRHASTDVLQGPLVVSRDVLEPAPGQQAVPDASVVGAEMLLPEPLGSPAGPGGPRRTVPGCGRPRRGRGGGGPGARAGRPARPRSGPRRDRASPPATTPHPAVPTDWHRRASSPGARRFGARTRPRAAPAAGRPSSRAPRPPGRPGRAPRRRPRRDGVGRTCVAGTRCGAGWPPPARCAGSGPRPPPARTATP